MLGNGYICQSGTYATHITGIPYTMDVTKNDGTWSVGSSGSTDTSRVNWNTDGGVRLGKNQTSSDIYITKTFHIPADISVKVTANGIHNGTGSLWKEDNTVTLTVGSTKVIEQTQSGNKEKAFSCSSANASMSSSKNTVKLNSNYNLSGAKVVLKALTIQY